MNKLELTRAIVRRTRGRTHGPTTRLISPSDFGQIALNRSGFESVRLVQVR